MTHRCDLLARAQRRDTGITFTTDLHRCRNDCSTFLLLNSADIIYVDSKESDGVLFDDNCLPGRKVPTARLLFENMDYYFLDQDVELVDGECVANAEDWGWRYS